MSEVTGEGPRPLMGPGFGPGSGVDVSQPGWNNSGSNKNLETLFNDAAENVESLASQMNDSGNMEVGQAVSTLRREPSSDGLGGGPRP